MDQENPNNQITKPKQHRVLKVFLVITVALILLIITAFIWIRSEITDSLPILEGELSFNALSARVDIKRDSIGVPVIHGSNKNDVIFALGFLHAQERFFQMDLIRRKAAGELAVLLGSNLVQSDRSSRVHQFREKARSIISNLSFSEKELLDNYVAGVNSGLKSLKNKPYEYIILQDNPQPWRNEDCILVSYSMYLDLAHEPGSYESTLGTLYDLLPDEMADFLAPQGSDWDAPVIGPAFSIPKMPGPDVFNVRNEKIMTNSHSARIENDNITSYTGSNNWAVSGSKTADGRAILANDMHLNISVPNIWYRAELVWGGEQTHRLAGVTVPGFPAIVAGSNFNVAWGFTNSFGDWVDLVKIEENPDDSTKYLTPNGYLSFESINSIILVKDAINDTLRIRSTIWGPIIGQDHRGQLYALRWIAHDTESINFGLLEMEKAKTVKQALAIANATASPPQNFVCADKNGNIGWTIIGKIPKRVGFNGKVPVSWAHGTKYWDGWLSPEKYPRIINPESGYIWTANARVIGGDMLNLIGNRGYHLGARAKQIRDSLFKLNNPQEADMLAIQMDDRAIFLQRWHDLLLNVLSPENIEGDSLRREYRDLIEETWTGRASISSTGYLLVRAYRLVLFREVYGWLTASCKKENKNFNFWYLRHWEGPLWKLITEQPSHLLKSKYNSWNDALLAVVDSTITALEIDSKNKKLHELSWGNRNTTSIKHPLSYAIPQISSWLDMPARRLSGDSNMPKVQQPRSGASERFAISPGKESEGYFHMPCGQSGHFMSPYYREGHTAWEEGIPTSFLSGKPKWILLLRPE
ncbi:penicillin acylase family protein [Candidatus Latescibacterota bacterium]